MKKTSNISSTIFMVLGLLLLAYGVYMIVYSINFVNTYTTSATISFAGSFQYIITSSISYLGFGAVFLGISLVLKKLNAVLNSGATADQPASAQAKSEAVANVTEVAAPVATASVATPVEAPAPVAPAPADVAPATSEPAPQPDPLALPKDGLPPVATNFAEPAPAAPIFEEVPVAEPAPVEAPAVDPAQTPMTLEEPPVVDEDTEPEFEVEYIYADDPAAEDVVSAEAPVEVAPSTNELSKVISELEEIKTEELAVAEETEKSFKITSDFIKDIFESK